MKQTLNAVVDYKRLGQEACERYFNSLQNDSQNLLEEIICDIARREELNPDEIARICQYANTRIFLKLFNTVPDKTVEFAVADPKRVAEAAGLGRLGSKRSGGGDGNDFEDGEGGVAFGDDWYLLDDIGGSDQPSEDFDHRIPLDYQELARHLHQLENSIDDMEVSMMEQRPYLVRDLASRIVNEGPKAVIIAVKSVGGPESLLKEAFGRAKVTYDDSDFDLGRYLVDDRDPLLQKVASYGRMCANMGKLKEMRDKVASIAAAIAKNPLKSLAFASEVSASSQKTKNLKSTMLTDEELPNRFRVKNAPRVSQPGLKGYVKSPY